MTTPEQAEQIRARWNARRRARRAAERAARGLEYRTRVIEATRTILIAAAREIGLEEAMIEWLTNERTNKETAE